MLKENALRLILTVAAVISAAIAGAIGCEWIHVEHPLLLASGWLGWAVCLLAAAALPWGVRLRRWFD